MPKRETIKFTHMGTYGEADLVDGVPVCVSWRTCTADWGQCGPELRHSVEQAIQARQPLETPFTRLARLEGEVRDTGATTLNINSGGDVNVRRPDGSTALSAGDLVAGASHLVYYDGTVYRLFSARQRQRVTRRRRLQITAD